MQTQPIAMKPILKSIVESSIKILPFKKQLFFTIRSFNPPKKIWNLLRFKGRFEVAINKRLSFCMNHNGYGFENSIFWKGLYKGWGEEQALRLWTKLCYQGATIFDIGANLGVYSLVAKTVNPQAQVYGFEPVTHLYQKFNQNCEINGFDIYCVPFALSNVDGNGYLYIKPGGFTTASLCPNSLRTETQRVETIALSTYIETNRINKIDLMKLDVEGHEDRVLQGMGRYLAEMKPVMIIEILSNTIGEKIEAQVEGCNYLYFNIDEHRGPLRQRHLNIEDKTRHSRNFLLCSEEIAGKLNLL